MSKQMTV